MDQRKPRGHEKIMPIRSLIFHVTAKLLYVTIRPLTPPLPNTQIIHGRLICKYNQMWLSCFSVMHKGWSKRHLHHWKRFPRSNVTSFDEELPHDVSNITPHLLSKWAAKECVLHWLRATMKTTLVNLCRILPCHSFTATALWITDQRNVAFFCALDLLHVMLVKDPKTFDQPYGTHAPIKRGM